MPFVTHAEFVLADMLVRYLAPANSPDQLGILLVPLSRTREIVPPREHVDTHATRHLPAHWQPVAAAHPDTLVHLHIRGQPRPGAFAQGRTMRGAPLAADFRVASPPQLTSVGKNVCITTMLENESGVRLTHELLHHEGDQGIRIRTTCENRGTEPLTLELVSSFSLGHLTPFAQDDAPEQLWLHRFRSAWSAEARLETLSIEALNLERSWVGHGVRAERFGQIGSMPTNGFFPFAAIEDRKAGVIWAAKISHPGSWQLEIVRKGDQLSLSGGLADYDFGHWAKRIAPGASFVTPAAFITTCDGSVAEASARFNATHQRINAPRSSRHEQSLPVIFNEWCTSWGNPTHDKLIALADELSQWGVRYVVIDDGWAERPGNGIQQNGDWILNRTAFPHGLRATADAIRARGLIPGIWFEFEVINAGAVAWSETSHQLHRDGVPLEVGNRRFWDFSDPWVHEYLEERVLRFLQDNHLGYLKVDYNDSIGVGCDGAESLGEGLRQHLDGVQRFFANLKVSLPELVIENCSSGGHRAEPSFVALTDMTSFSDAHETPDIPIIAANVNRLIPPRQNQIWAVLRKDDSVQRLSYSLAAAFLGRMCLSGDIHELSPVARQFIRDAIALYNTMSPAVEFGRFQRHTEINSAYQHLRGWQAVVMERADNSPAYLVWHAFGDAPEKIQVEITSAQPLRLGPELAAHPTHASFAGTTLIIPINRDWSGGVITFQSTLGAARVNDRRKDR